MVGMDAPVNPEKPKERDCPCALSLKSNGELPFHPHDSKLPFQPHDLELPGALVDYGKCNGKLAALSPITPDPRRENGDSVSMNNSPLSSESPKSPNVDGFSPTESDGTVGSGHDYSPRTPKDGVFDPFAPGPEEMLLAPMCKKLVKKPQKIVARRLDFHHDDYDGGGDDSPKSEEDGTELETLYEKTVLDAVYGTLLEAIVLKQTEDFLAENSPSVSESLSATPTSPPPSLTRIAETCPRAPMKAIPGKSRNIDPGLCRKLEF